MNATFKIRPLQKGRQLKYSEYNKASIYSVVLFVSSILLLLSVNTIVYAEELLPADALVIVDANEKVVGPLSSFNNSKPVVPVKYGERIFMLRISERGDDFLTYNLYFESDDCSGTPYLGGTDAYWLLYTARVVGPNRTVYLPDLDAPRRVITRRSEISVLNSDECQPSIFTFLAIPAIPIVDLYTLFTPPFSVQENAAPNLQDLQQQITDTQTDLIGHEHTYLTGEGEGHNKFPVSTGEAIFP